MIKGSHHEENGKDNVHQVEKLKDLSADNGQRRHNHGSHEQYEQCPTAVHRVLKEKLPKDAAAFRCDWVHKSDVGVKQAVEVGKSGGDLVILNGSFNWHSEEERQHVILGGGDKAKYQGYAAGVASDGYAWIDKREDDSHD